MKRITIATILLLFVVTLSANDDLYIRFNNPPQECKTKFWWFHGETETTKEGYEADVMSAEAANIHYDNYFKAVLDTLSSVGCPPVGMCMDSHEAGCQNWTAGLENIFSRRNGYSLTPFYTAMARYVLE